MKSLALPQPTGGLNLRGVLPMDAVPGAAYTACYGVGALTYKWKRGKLFDMIVGGNTYTISAVNGYPDIKRIAALLGISAVVGIKGALISKWYDQSGNGNDATQATTANQPAIWLINGVISIFFCGVLSQGIIAGSPSQYLTIPTTASFNSQSFSIFSLFNPYANMVGYNGGTPTGTTPTLSFSTLFSIYNGSNGFDFYFPNNLGAVAATSGILDLSTFGGVTAVAPEVGSQSTIFGGFGTASGCSTTVNEQLSSSVTALTAATITGARLGADESFFTAGASGRMQAFVASSTQFSTAQQSQMRAALYQYGQVLKSPIGSTASVNIVIDGASFSQGRGGDPSGLYPTQNGGGYGSWEMTKDAFKNYAIQWSNMAASGDTIQNRTADYSPMTSKSFNASAAKNILIGPNDAYANSIGIGGRTGAQAYTDFLAWLAAVKANSWTTILCYLLPSSGNTDFATYNSSMQTNASANGVTLIDMSADTSLTLNASPPYFNSDGHPTIAGYEKIAAYTIPAVQQALGL